MRKLNLGCGKRWQELYSDYEGLDIVNYGQKYIGDVRNILLDVMLEEEKFDEVMANHFLEHFDQDDLRVLLVLVWLSLKDGGLFRFVVPHKDREEAWDLSHKTFWNENTVKRLENNKYYGNWKIKELIVNERKNIHVLMEKV